MGKKIIIYLILLALISSGCIEGGQTTKEVKATTLPPNTFASPTTTPAPSTAIPSQTPITPPVTTTSMTVLATTTPLPTTQPSTPVADYTKENGVSLDAEILNELEEKGLTDDVKDFIDLVQKEQAQKYTSDFYALFNQDPIYISKLLVLEEDTLGKALETVYMGPYTSTKTVPYLKKALELEVVDIAFDERFLGEGYTAQFDTARLDTYKNLQDSSPNFATMPLNLQLFVLDARIDDPSYIESIPLDFDPYSDEIGKIVYHPPTNEIKYSYYHYIPESALKRIPIRVLLYGHSSPQLDTYQQMEEYVESQVSKIKPFCDKFGYVLIVMVTPRKWGSYPDYKMNTQSMARWVMFDNNFDKSGYEFYKRPDLEFEKVIDDFMSHLQSRGYVPYPKVFMTGFSNGGIQSNRFPILHPEKVAATAIGAAGAYLYPVDTWNGNTLTYPVGINDIDQIPDNTYSLAEFKQIPHYIFVGENDLDYGNDPVNFDDNFDREQANIINTYLGSNAVKRAEKYSDYLNSIGTPSEFKLYRGIGHSYSDEMIEDSFYFFDSQKIASAMVSTP